MDFTGPPLVGGGESTEVSWRSDWGPGEGDGEAKATFLWTSAEPEPALPLAVLRELRPAESWSERD